MDVRKHFVPIGHGPWVEDRSMHRAWKWTGGVGVALMLGTGLLVRAGLSPVVGGVLVVVGGMLTCVGIVWGLVTLLPRLAQTCPQCLQGMTRGATKCPYCHFEESQASR